VQKKKSGSSTGEIYTASWFAYKHLLFILDGDEAREGKDTIITLEESLVSICVVCVYVLYVVVRIKLSWKIPCTKKMMMMIQAVHITYSFLILCSLSPDYITTNLHDFVSFSCSFLLVAA
jgi:hypothetical protein